MKKVKPYLIEFAIVTAGVLIALFLSNIKENNQARKYHIASIGTINMEVQDNYSNLERIVEKQMSLLDTLIKYTNDSESTILDLFKKSNGLQIATIKNAGLDFYKNDQINSIDFKIMAALIQMKSSSDLIDSKAQRLTGFTYSNILDNSTKSKTVVILYLQNLLDTENQLLELYEEFINENIEIEHNTK
ncbi:hypothetical protein [uncultured Sunxiuqinia sp.]|uniref:hypothetical protein n=1 Tax=uncultured Sunxiuqinia sp. TaxID=1573825 RepID=UPI002AA717B4|nr:hypothetical protein [uncultured Sunxiuqinia sp.]